MDEDMFLEAEYEERYEGEDYNLWEEQQVFLDNEGHDEPSDPETDFPEPEMAWDE